MCQNSDTGSYQDHQAILTETVPLGKDITLAKLQAPAVARVARPGQFLLVRPASGTDPLLGRPLAIVTCEGSTVALCFQTVGRGTTMLKELPPQSVLPVRGPQGNGFGTPRGQRLILAGGALGIAPLVFAEQQTHRRVETQFFAGVSCSTWKPLIKWLDHRIRNLHVTCDDGTIGFHGNVVHLLKDHLRPGDEIWACGPLPMMKALHNLAVEKGAMLKVSLEERMACGFGGCLGCVIPAKDGHRRVCVDGPVFDSMEVDWDALD